VRRCQEPAQDDKQEPYDHAHADHAPEQKAILVHALLVETQPEVFWLRLGENFSEHGDNFSVDNLIFHRDSHRTRPKASAGMA
jgi:hypothetical protein